MANDPETPIVPIATAEKGKRLSRGQRIHRRRLLAQQRREQKDLAVTTRV